MSKRWGWLNGIAFLLCGVLAIDSALRGDVAWTLFNAGFAVFNGYYYLKSRQ